MMSKIEDLLKKYCPNGVTFESISSVCRTVTPKFKVKSHDYAAEGLFPIIDQGQEFIGGYTNEDYAFPKGEYVIFGDHTCVVKYVDFPFVQGADGVKVLSAYSDKVLPKYLFYCMSNVRMIVDYARHWSKMAKLLIPIPPIEIQREIVRILDVFTDIIRVLNMELAERKKQYDFYLERFFSFKTDISKSYEWKTLGEISTDIYRGSGITREQITGSGVPCVRYGEIYTTYGVYFDKCESHTILENVKSPKYFEHGDILFAITGEKVEDIAKCSAYIGNDKCLAGGDIVVLKHNQNPKYLAYALSTKDAIMQKCKGKVKSKVVHSSVPAIRDLKIPIPSLTEQERIVKILDKFNILTNDISVGIPAEIEARKKQYEYYREKLLTFAKAN